MSRKRVTTDAADRPKSRIRIEELIVVDSFIGFLEKLKKNIKWDEKC